MKNKIAEKNLLRMGYKIEWRTSPRGTQLCTAIKEGFKQVYSKTLIGLEKEVIKQHNIEQ